MENFAVGLNADLDTEEGVLDWIHCGFTLGRLIFFVYDQDTSSSRFIHLE